MSIENIPLIISALSVIISTVVAILTFSYVRVTKQTLREMQISREQENRPYLVFYFERNEPGTMLYHLTLRNFGKTAAILEQLKLDPPIVDIDSGISERLNNFFSQQNVFIAPSQKLMTIHNFNGYETKTFTATVVYKDTVGNTFNESYQVSFEPFQYLLDVVGPSSSDTDLNKSLSSISYTLKVLLRKL